MHGVMMFTKLILLLITIFVNQITSKNITFHNVVIEACAERNEITIAEGERIKDFIPRNCSFLIHINKQTMPILFENSFGDIAMVEFLNLTNNSISEIRPGVFTGSSDLERIDLQENSIEEIKAGVFNNLNIRTLSLGHNSISKIDSSAFDNMPALDRIHLGHNKISTWDPNWFRNSHGLRFIQMNYNEIKYLPSRGFEGMLENMESQSEDDARGSPENSDSIRKVISYISVEHNQISSIENDFLNGISVIVFNLAYNNIVCLEDSEFQVLAENFYFLDLFRNPLNCDCVDRMKRTADQNKIDANLSEMISRCSNETVN